MLVHLLNGIRAILEVKKLARTNFSFQIQKSSCVKMLILTFSLEKVRRSFFPARVVTWFMQIDYGINALFANGNVNK